MQQLQAFFGGGRGSAEPGESVLAEWNKCGRQLTSARTTNHELGDKNMSKA